MAVFFVDLEQVYADFACITIYGLDVTNIYDYEAKKITTGILDIVYGIFSVTLYLVLSSRISIPNFDGC